MSIFMCASCDNYIDSDFDGCNPDPKDPDSPAMLCDYCYEKMLEDGVEKDFKDVMFEKETYL